MGLGDGQRWCLGAERRGHAAWSLQVLGKDEKPVRGLYCIGDANGKYMLAHAASAQGISAVENICGREHIVNHLAVPAACFTHPEVTASQCLLCAGGCCCLAGTAVPALLLHGSLADLPFRMPPLMQVSFVGLTEDAAREKAEKDGYADRVAVAKTYFKGNSKALAELEGDGMGKLIYRQARCNRKGGALPGRLHLGAPDHWMLCWLRWANAPPRTDCRKDTGEILGVHLFGLHAADLIHEFSNAVAMKQPVQVSRPGELQGAMRGAACSQQGSAAPRAESSRRECRGLCRTSSSTCMRIRPSPRWWRSSLGTLTWTRRL